MSFLRRDWNVNAKFENSKIHLPTEPLVVMRSVDTTPNARVPLNTPIANFPQDADAVSQLNGTLSSPIFFKFL
jgi:hypothetical protein